MVREARSAAEVAAFASLCREYGATLQYTCECASLEHQGFDQELATLPGRYGPPSGVILLAWDGSDAVGCVALRDLGAGCCEMKRMYVRPSHRGRGVGRMLGDGIVAKARILGYRAMRLDTGASMQVAAAMYRAMGFREIPAYNRDPVPGTVWMELTLSPSPPVRTIPHHGLDADQARQPG